jgi:hypothetical protein
LDGIIVKQGQTGRVLYEIWNQRGCIFCRLFILCKAFHGTLTLANRGEKESFLVDARFFSQDDLHEMDVHPEILKGQFWSDLEAGFPLVRYLGLEKMRY